MEGLDKSGGEGGLKLQASRKPRFTREITAISFTIAGFQFGQVKRFEVSRSPSKPKEWRKTVARSSPNDSCLLDRR
jgi:hypothetical protein